ncbi:ThiF family protein [Paraburkholderia sp. BL23I1N1]|uniref:Mov34/MPN/PAD-1 family protein n=1 Tax=Paraburkholderia sp. BL23I1N1 TaxID=1938802 RepID=UPI000E75F1AA|nr:Mov34/MPN/PAD-1 family protein [Paraburkholderia sp. BL23I1N1]RKE25263.1 ThiF family protein [Paraburkholderia sp. BL23I1N1]
MADEFDAQVTPAIRGAIETLKAHPAVLDAQVIGERNGVWAVIAHISVNLPSRAAAAGRSENGVLASEEVLVAFPANFPTAAPRFTLRADFPTNLPHIYPHSAGDPVPPCITVGDQRDILHDEGIYRLIVQLSDWLDRAAIDELTNNEQGWEPSRRDAKFNVLQIDPDSLVPSNPPGPPLGGWRMFMCPTLSWDDRTMSLTWKGYMHKGGLSSEWMAKTVQQQKTWERGLDGVAPILVCWPTSGGPNGAPVDITYKADTVQTLAQMAARATELGCRVSVDDFVSNFNRLVVNERNRGRLHIFFVFPIRRPIHIIGQKTPYEMLAYRVELAMPERLDVGSDKPVTMIAFNTPIGAALLKRTSGLSERSTAQYVFAGCGSLGSKLVMHVARAGIRPSLLIDSKIVVAHNAARHTLLPDDVARLSGKARRLSQIVASFGRRAPTIFEDDLRKLDFTDIRYRGAFAGDEAFVVNTTGSPAVRNFLTQAPISARVVEAALVNRGHAAFMTIEGPQRTPTSTELMYHCYERMRKAGILRSSEDAENHTLDIGVGCHSVTIAMSDARVSLVAAGVGQKLLQIDDAGRPPTGIAALAMIGDDGMSIQWNSDSVGATQIAKVYDSNEWTVRVLDAAHRQIVDNVAQYPGLESGGLIVGSVSVLTREIFITGTIPAPSDSQRSAARFVLGVEGREDAIRRYQASANGTLWCLGTWHSHLQPSGPSQMDRDTAALLDGQLKHAAVLLIRHPEGYAALVREGSAN